MIWSETEENFWISEISTFKDLKINYFLVNLQVIQSRSKLLAHCVVFPHRPKLSKHALFACIFTTTGLQTFLNSSLFLELWISSPTGIKFMKANIQYRHVNWTTPQFTA